jgi:hypothetical protein
MLLAACGTSPRPIELRPLQVLDQHQQVMAQSDVGGILQQAATAAQAGDKAKVISLLHDARQSLGTGLMSTGNSMQPLAKHIDAAINQIEAADVNVREVSSIAVNQVQDTLKSIQNKKP